MINYFMFGLSYLELWFAIGVICIILELVVIQNVGFLFLGLGSLSNALLIYNYPLFQYHYITFASFSALWFILLWWPLKYYMHKNNSKQPYSDMVGREVEVYDDEIMSGKIGKVRWSGTIMNAKLTSKDNGPSKIGDRLYVIAVSGNVLICSKHDIPQ